MSATAPSITSRCDRCGSERATKPTAAGAPRLPGGWKRMGERVYCDRCWRASYVLRAITLPIAAPLEGDWKELRAALHECWSNATQLANWAVTELVKADVVRTPDMEKLPPMPRVYLYPGARSILPDMDTASVVSLLQAVEQRYRKARFDVIWRRAASPPSFRYPMPYPVHNQRWSVREEEGRGLILSVPLAGRRWDLVLKTGGRGRQRAAVRKLIAGEAAAGELAIYERGSNVMAKMVMWLPREDRQRGRSGTLYVRTTEDAVWEYRIEDGEPRYLYADHVRQWLAAYKRRSERATHDLKYEKRWPAKVRRRHLQDLEPMRRKHRARMDTWTHEATAMLAGFADRARVARVVYDDQITSYADLPWYQLRERLAYKLDGLGIEFVHAMGEAVAESATPLETAD